VIASLLLREVPAQLLSGVGTGEYKVYGSIIRSVANGRIVGHLQETSGLTRLAGKALTEGIPGFGTAVDLAGHTVSYVQNEQIKAAVNVVQNLQIANLAVSAAGIGVSVAGFAVLAAKIGRVEAKVEALGDRLDAIARGVAFLRRDRIAEDFTRLRTAAQMLDEAWLLSDPLAQWRHVAEEAIFLSNQFERRALELLGDNPDPIAAEPFLEALAFASSARVQARLASGEDAVARKAAEEGALTLMRAGDRLGLAQAAVAGTLQTAVPVGTQDWSDALDARAKALRDSVAGTRAREAAAVGSALTLEELERQGISGRAWLEEARAEAEAPLLFLPLSEAKPV
jgi:hypothetical protein